MPVVASDLVAFLRGKGLPVSEKRILEVAERFCQIMQKPEIAAVFRPDYYAHFLADRLQVEREYRFALRYDDNLLSGSLDRLVVGYQGDRACNAEIIDFKTDQPEAASATDWLDRKKLAYAPQIAAYRYAVSRLTGLSIEKISAKLLFVEADIVCYL